jgi:hypothetical protein
MNDTGMVEHIEAVLGRIDAQQAQSHAELVRLVKERNAYRAALLDLEFLFEDKVDIKDGPEGQQLPNDAMQAMTIIRRVL